MCCKEVAGLWGNPGGRVHAIVSGDPGEPGKNCNRRRPSLRSRYKWGIRKDFTISYGIVHLKAKKQCQKGRTTISYYHSMAGNLLHITSRALAIILQHLFPQHPGQLSIPQLWHHFHSYLSQAPADITLHATNDDPVGFFNSVPQHRLIDAVHSLVQEWQTQQSTQVDTKATAIPFTTLILADTMHDIPHNAPFIPPTSPPSWRLPSTPVFSGLATTLTNKSEAQGLAPAVSSPLQCGHHPHRTLLAPATQQPPPPLRPTLHLLSLCGQPLHRTQRTFPLPPSHPNIHPPQLFRRSLRT